MSNCSRIEGIRCISENEAHRSYGKTQVMNPRFKNNGSVNSRPKARSRASSSTRKPVSVGAGDIGDRHSHRLFSVAFFLVAFAALYAWELWSLAVVGLAVVVVAVVVAVLAKRVLPDHEWYILLMFLGVISGVTSVPILYGWAQDKLTVVNGGADEIMWSKAAVLEFAFLCAWVAGFLWPGVNMTFAEKTLTRHIQRASPMFTVLLLLSLGMLASYGLPLITSSVYGASQWLALEAESRAAESTKVVLLNTFKAFVAPCLCVLFFYSKNQVGKLSCLAGIGFVTLHQFSTGARAGWVLTLLSLAFCAAISGQRLRNVILLLSLPAAGLLFTSAALQLYRADDVAREGFRSQLERFESYKSAHSQSSLLDNLEALVTRLDLIQAGSFLMREADETGTVGFRPYRGLPFLFVPRSVYPEKPVAGSATGRAEDMPCFLVANLRGQPGNSNSYGVGAACYWQFGRIGVVVVGALSGMLIRFLGRSLMQSGILGQVLLLNLMIYSYFFYSDVGWTVRWALLTLVPTVLLLPFLPGSGQTDAGSDGSILKGSHEGALGVGKKRRGC